MGGYTEGSSATVTAPLTYSAVNTNAKTVLAGLGANYKVMSDVTLIPIRLAQEQRLLLVLITT